MVMSVVFMAPGDHPDMDDDTSLFTQSFPLQGTGTLVTGCLKLEFGLGGHASGLKCCEVSDFGGCDVDYNC